MLGSAETRREDLVRCSHVTLLAAVMLGLSLLSTGATAQETRTRAARDTGRVSTTPDNQILVELAPKDTTAANLFDLNGRTLVFTPDGHGGYSRSVQSVAWEDTIGRAVADGAEVELQSFMFDFAGRRWGSFFVSRHGALTFGGALSYRYRDSGNRFSTMREIAAAFVDKPTISPLYKPSFGGVYARDPLANIRIAQLPDRVVVTWFVSEPEFYVGGSPPATPDRFQAVLHADGGITFSYGGVSARDGIVGLFLDDGVVRGGRIASIPDARNPELPGHLDLLEAAVYAANADGVVLEFTTREPVPDPNDGTRLSYRLYFDVDPPYWSRYGDGSDMDFAWVIDVTAGGERVARSFVRDDHAVKLLDSGAENQVALLARIDDPAGISAAVIADAAEFDNGGWVQGDNSRPESIELPASPAATSDMSQPDTGFSGVHVEVFQYRGSPDLEKVACRVVEAFGDRFDVLVFHNEFRVDKQENAAAGRTFERGIEGLGFRSKADAPCGTRQLRRIWNSPTWIYTLNAESMDGDLATFAHEFVHAWTAWLSYEREGESERLFGNYCRCHWRPDLHTPAAFPWRGAEAQSIMGGGSGRFWRDNGDGTYTSIDNYRGSGPSWLDLYAIGLAHADEVPEMFILRNLKVVEGQGYCRSGRYCNGSVWTGDREIVSIEQVMAAEGPRDPSAANSEQDFNSGFVYLLEPGQTPDPDMLRLHRDYRDRVVEHWSHVTGGRSRMTTAVPSVANRSPWRSVR